MCRLYIIWPRSCSQFSHHSHSQLQSAARTNPHKSANNSDDIEDRWGNKQCIKLFRDGFSQFCHYTIVYNKLSGVGAAFIVCELKSQTNVNAHIIEKLQIIHIFHWHQSHFTFRRIHVQHIQNTRTNLFNNFHKRIIAISAAEVYLLSLFLNWLGTERDFWASSFNLSTSYLLSSIHTNTHRYTDQFHSPNLILSAPICWLLSFLSFPLVRILCF